MSLASFEYLFAFFPVAVVGYFGFARLAPRAGSLWLIAISLVFYAWAGVRDLPYLLTAAAFNFWIGARMATADDPLTKRRLLRLGIAANTAQLLVVKYSAFLLTIVGLGSHASQRSVPVGISFYTLIQVMYLMDCYEGLAVPNGLLDHLLFSSFFPYVTMGPLVRVRDMTPLLRVTERPRFDVDGAALGFELFVLGLFKKAVLAQSCAHLADSGWGLTRSLSSVEAWVTTVAFTFELYFDFSGYTDMALGTAKFFGVKLPLNFDSPYKATSIIAFWRRWHISLSAFITTYLYTPLLRLRRRPSFTWAMSMTVVAMTIAGLWHGAAWTFVAFGLLHGVALVINNVWRKTKRRFPRALGGILTFTFVVGTLVLFRAANLAAALHMFASMLGLHGLGGFDGDLFVGGAPGGLRGAIALVAALACFLLPNSNALSLKFKPSVRRALTVAVVALIAVIFMNSIAAKEFIYRDF